MLILQENKPKIQRVIITLVTIFFQMERTEFFVVFLRCKIDIGNIAFREYGLIEYTKERIFL